jgi:hypothetical protein
MQQWRREHIECDGAGRLGLLDSGTDLVVALDPINRERDAARTRGRFELLQTRGRVGLGVGEHRHGVRLREEIKQDLLALGVQIGGKKTHSGCIAAGMGEP